MFPQSAPESAASIGQFYRADYGPHQRVGLSPKKIASARRRMRLPAWWRARNPHRYGLPPSGQCRLLDVGCGGGEFLHRMHCAGLAGDGARCRGIGGRTGPRRFGVAGPDGHAAPCGVETGKLRGGHPVARLGAHAASVGHVSPRLRPIGAGRKSARRGAEHRRRPSPLVRAGVVWNRIRPSTSYSSRRQRCGRSYAGQGSRWSGCGWFPSGDGSGTRCGWPTVCNAVRGGSAGSPSTR